MHADDSLNKMTSKRQDKKVLKTFSCVKSNSLNVIAEVCIAQGKYLNIDFQKSWLKGDPKVWSDFSFGFSLSVESLVALQQSLPDIVAYARKQEKQQQQSGMQS